MAGMNMDDPFGQRKGGGVQNSPGRSDPMAGMNMDDPFGQKKGGGVQNSPPRSDPYGGGGGYS